MEFEYTLNKQACALLCWTTASVLCWTGASFCPEFKICKEKTEGREYLHLPVVTSRSRILVFPPHQARNTNSHVGQLQPGVSLSPCWPGPITPALCQTLQWAGSHRHCHGSRAFPLSQIHLPSSAWGIGCGVCGSVQRTGTQTCCDVLALQFTTGSNSLASAEEMGKTRSSKH